MDQAAGLRQMMMAPPIGVLAFPMATPSREAWIAPLAHALRGFGGRPLVLDAGRGTVASAFGLRLRHELIDLLEGAQDFDTVARATDDGVYVLRAARGVEAFVASGAPAARLLGSFGRLSHGFDHLMLAMPANELACLAGPAASVPVVGLDGGAGGLLRSYGLVKQLAQGFGYRRFTCVLHGACEQGAAQREYGRLAAAAEYFLDVEVTLAGRLPPPGDPDRLSPMRLADALLQTAAQAPTLHPSPARDQGE